VKEVSRWKVGKKVKDTLRPDEVPLLLENLDERWVPLFATAIWTGLRKGELAALRRTSVNLRVPGEETLVIRASWDEDRTKNEDQDLLPVPGPLVPYLRQALAASTSDLLFPGPERRDDVGGHQTARWCFVVRSHGLDWSRAGCTPAAGARAAATPHVESHEDDKPRQCPVCDMRLWPKPVYRRITFHGLREPPERCWRRLAFRPRLPRKFSGTPTSR
jgi:integrase